MKTLEKIITEEGPHGVRDERVCVTGRKRYGGAGSVYLSLVNVLYHNNPETRVYVIITQWLWAISHGLHIEIRGAK